MIACQRMYQTRSKIIGIYKSDDTNLLIDIDDKLRDDITSKNVLKLMTRVKKDNDKFSEQFFLEEKLFIK